MTSIKTTSSNISIIFRPALTEKSTLANGIIISKQFVDRMSKGNINGAIKLLSNNMQEGILPLNAETLNLMRQKHPKEKTPSDDVLLKDTPIKIHPIRYEEFDAELIRQAALKTKGGAGPSGLDGDG